MPPEYPAAGDPPDKREAHATLAAGLFTNGVWDMLSIIVPLYAVAAGLSVSEIGFIVAARSVLPTALSIHGGILMDRWGTRRVLTRLSIASIALPLLYPLSGWFGVLVLLQLILGLASSLGMAASQTWSLQSSHGDTATLARFSIFSRIGTFVGPVMIGAIWDAFGAWPAFACISLWAAGILGSAAYGAPASSARSEETNAPRGPVSTGFSELLPRWAEHKDALALAAIPAVAFVLAVSFLRNSPGAIQSSFYVVYLGDAGFSGTMIGALVGLSEFFGVVGSLAAAPLERLILTRRLVIACIVSSIAAIALTPLIGHFLVLLFVAAAVRGVAQGVSQPLMYSILGRAVPAAMHGATVGLRNSVTRLASIVTPAFMGIVAEVWGIEASFYFIGGLFLAATLALGVVGGSVLAERRRAER
jgi:MFS family permease